MSLVDMARRCKRKIIERVAYYNDFIRGRHAFQMWGRVFDLRKKRYVNLGDFGIYVMPSDYIGRSILEGGNYESHVTGVIRNNLRDGDVFLDLGANIGYFTMLAGRLVGEAGKVIAVEPNPQNLQLMYASLLQNSMTNVDIYPYAASDTAGILRFTTVGSNGGVVTEHSRDQKHFLLVPSVTLDHVLRDVPRIDLVKIDIEAHELAAIRGMENTIRRLKPRIITEFHPWAMTLNNTEPPVNYLHKLIDLGYQLSVIEPNGTVLEMQDAENILSYWRSLGKEMAHLDLLAQPKSQGSLQESVT